MQSSDKLLPDWGNPVFYPGIPPGAPAPPLLVLDVEKTCIGSVYDASTGWKHVKRPGLDELLNQVGAAPLDRSCVRTNTTCLQCSCSSTLK